MSKGNNIAEIGVTNLILRTKSAVAINQLIELFSALGEDLKLTFNLFPFLANGTSFDKSVPPEACDGYKVLYGEAPEKPQETATERKIDMFE